MSGATLPKQSYGAAATFGIRCNYTETESWKVLQRCCRRSRHVGRSSKRAEPLPSEHRWHVRADIRHCRCTPSRRPEPPEP